jgi:hypothetical protein
MKHMISLPNLADAIEASWSADTCFDASEWTPQNPARGQCVPTALVVHHYLGGTLQKYDTIYNAQPENHYANILPDGTVVDLAGRQYPPSQELIPSEVNLHGHRDVIDKMMHEPETVRKFHLLLKRVSQKLRA